jgi:hypothetical protein
MEKKTTTAIYCNHQSENPTLHPIGDLPLTALEHPAHVARPILNKTKERNKCTPNILAGQSPIDITEQFNPFKAMCVNIVEHKGFVNYIVRNTSSYLTQALHGTSSEQ